MPSGVIAIAAGWLPTVTGVPAVIVDSVTGVTVPSVQFASNAVFPSGVIATADGSLNEVGELAELVAVLIGDTDPEPKLATYAV